MKIAIAVLVMIASVLPYALAESVAASPYTRVNASEYSLDVPALWVMQPPSNFDMFSLIMLDILNAGPLLETLTYGRTDSFVDPAMVQEYPLHPPTIAITVGPSHQSTEAFSSDYNSLMTRLYLLQSAQAYLTYKNHTEYGGILSEWYVVDAARSAWMHMTSYALVTNGTAYIIEYYADADTYDAGYPHFERAVSSFVPYSVANATAYSIPDDPKHSVDPRCTGTAHCITGNVTRVIDGDTIMIDDIRVRLALVNTDDTDTSRGVIAKTIVGAVCQTGSHAVIDQDDGQTQGSYGRMLGVVWCGEVNLNGFLMEIDFGRIDTRFCDASEFSGEPWAAACGE